MRSFLKLGIAMSMALSLMSCAAIEAQHQADLQQFQARYCNYDGAFESGVNAANRNESMDGNSVAASCAPEKRATVMQGYRAGYMSVASRPGAPAPLVVINPGNSFQNPARSRQCIEAFGHKTCGYGCREAFGQVRCANDPRHDCVESYGKIYCGLNCKEEFGKVSCDETE